MPEIDAQVVLYCLWAVVCLAMVAFLFINGFWQTAVLALGTVVVAESRYFQNRIRVPLFIVWAVLCIFAQVGAIYVSAIFYGWF